MAAHVDGQRPIPDGRPVDRAQCESTMFVGSGIETVILAGFARGMAESGARRRAIVRIPTFF